MPLNTFELFKLTHLTLEDAEHLSNTSKSIHLPSLRDIELDVAENLTTYNGDLHLDGITTPSINC